MDIKKIFEDPRVKMLEEDIAQWNNGCSYNDEECHVMEYLLLSRRRVLAELNVYDDDMKRLLTEFNEALRKACTELYHRVIVTYEKLSKQEEDFGELEVDGKIFLDFEYSPLHPIQTQRAKEVWDALTQGFQKLYDDGCAWPLYIRGGETPDGPRGLLEWLGMEDESDNWNEGLDREWSKDMHLVQPFHNLYDHLNFSLYDLIFVREFNLEVNVKYDGNILIANGKEPHQ